MTFAIELMTWLNDDSKTQPVYLEFEENDVGVRATVSFKPVLNISPTAFGYTHKEAIQGLRGQVVALSDAIRALERNHGTGMATIRNSDVLEDFTHSVEKNLWPLCIIEPSEFEKLKTNALA